MAQPTSNPERAPGITIEACRSCGSSQLTSFLDLGTTPLADRLVTEDQLRALSTYTDAIWDDCRELEKMWIQGELDAMIDIEEEELEIARMQPWGGSPAIFAADGLFSFGAHPEE